MRRYKLYDISAQKITLLLVSLLIMLLLLPAAQAAKVVTIGIITDGPIEHTSWSPSLFKDELRLLTQADFEVHFPVEKQLDGGWSAERISVALNALQNDPDVDMVLALGYISSAVAALNRPLYKPTFAPFVMDAQLQGLPRSNNSSGIPYLNYLSSDTDFTRDLHAFNSVVECKVVAVFIDDANYIAQPELIRRAKEVTSAAGVELRFIRQQTRNEDLVALLPVDVDAVVVTDLMRLNAEAMTHLIEVLIEKKLPSYSLLDSQLVEKGLLMSEAPATDWRRLARRNALNMHAVMHGELAEQQPVSFKSKRHLTINMATARAIGISPRFDILHEAILINPEPVPQGESLSLTTVALESVAANLELRAAALGLEVGETAVGEARAQLFPQLDATINYTQLDDRSSMVISGARAEQSTSAVLMLSQLLYSEQVQANVEIQRYLQENRQALKRQLELDIILEATTAYLDVLKAQTFVRIRQEDMQLSRTNLELARDRQQIGVANPAEVYRWESELATSRRGLLDAQAQRQQTQNSLNRLLHRPLNTPFIAEPATLDGPHLIVSRKALFEYVLNNHTFELLGDFMVKEGRDASPELIGLEALLAVTQRKIESEQRAYWSPIVTLQGAVTQVMDETRSAGLAEEGDTVWSVGVNLSLPLFEGGARHARLTGSRLLFDQQRVQREAIGEKVEQRIRAMLHRIGASYPSIQLSKDAADSANKNLNIVTEAYSRGAISILDLLDAQNAALVAEESASNAIFDFLIDVMNLQRSYGGFDLFLDEHDMDNWLQRLKHYIATEGRDEYDSP